MELFIISFISWTLTILAPCILPLLPIILAWTSQNNSKKTWVEIILWLSISVFIFSIILKTTTLFIDLPNSFWTSISGLILIFLWIITIFPNLWKKISMIFKLDQKTNSKFNESLNSNSKLKNYFIWASLWPVFSSCSPTYWLILAVILPNNFAVWSLYLISYILWLAFVLLLISLFWQKMIQKLRFISNPNGNFKKFLWVIFLIIWLFIFTGLDKKFEAKIIENWYFDTIDFENNLIKKIDF